MVSVAAKNALEKSAKRFFLRLEIALDRIEGCPVVLKIGDLKRSEYGPNEAQQRANRLRLTEV